MSLWVLEPRDPIVVHDGRPSQGALFPLPSIVAGAVRTRVGSDSDGVFVKQGDELEALRSVGVRGPWLVDPGAGILYAPTPSDLALGHGDVVDGLSPAESPKTLVDDGFPLALVTSAHVDSEGAGRTRNRPAFLRWGSFVEWLRDSGRRDHEAAKALLAGAIDALPREDRVQVPVGEDAKSFRVVGLRLMHPDTREPLALAVDVDDASASRCGELREGLAPFGGKRRLVRWGRSSQELPEIPAEVLDGIGAAGDSARVRVILLTPAVFAEGWRPSLSPGAPLGPGEGITDVTLVGACVGEPLTLSGWDLATNRPKRIRRAAAEGSVYWLELRGEPEARRHWARRVWARAVSDALQDRRDGFGVAAVGLAPRARGTDGEAP